MDNDKYILVNGLPVPEPDLMKWGEWFESAIEERMVGRDDIDNGVRVSTVFLGMDHRLPWDESEDRKPVLWETMIFGGPCDQEQWRWTSLEDAKAGHQKAVRLAKLENVWFRRVWHWLRNIFLK